jgi:glycosyltransferase involved in cell wall biosynthesis
MSGQVESTVVAPVPWFPFTHRAFGAYAVQARAPRAETRNGIEVLHPRFPVLPKIGMTLTPFLLYRAVRPLVERLRRERGFDLIDAHYFYPDGVAAAMLARFLGVPAVITARGSDVNVIAQQRLPRRMIRWAAHQASAVIAVSQALKEGLTALGIQRERIHVLRNGVDLEQFHPRHREALRAELGLFGPTLLSAGNLFAFKGHGLAIEALARLPQCELIIAGEGPDRAAFEDLARQHGVSRRVRFVGLLGQQDLRRYFCAADALILASSREGWPNVLLEAMACGTPVVATRVGGVPEIVTHPDAGAIVEERSAAAIAQGIGSLLARPPQRPATRRHAEQFGWGATTRGQLQLFRRILSLDDRAAREPEPVNA